MGYVFKAEFLLPDNVSNIINVLGDPFDVSTHSITSFDRKRRNSDDEQISEGYKGFDSEQNEKYEMHNIEAEIVESGTETTYNSNNGMDDELLVPEDYEFKDDPMALKVPQNTATSRWTLYKGFSTIAERFEILFFFLHFLKIYR